MSEGLVIAIRFLDKKDGGKYAKITVDGTEYIAGKFSYDSVVGLLPGDRISFEGKPSADGEVMYIGKVKKLSSGGGANPTEAHTTAPLAGVATPRGKNDKRIEMQVMYKIAGEVASTRSYANDSELVAEVSSVAKQLHEAFLRDISEEATANPT